MDQALHGGLVESRVAGSHARSGKTVVLLSKRNTLYSQPPTTSETQHPNDPQKHEARRLKPEPKSVHSVPRFFGVALGFTHCAFAPCSHSLICPLAAGPGDCVSGSFEVVVPFHAVGLLCPVLPLRRVYSRRQVEDGFIQNMYRSEKVQVMVPFSKLC